MGQRVSKPCVTSLLEQLATNAMNGDIGQHSALGTQEPQGQAPSLPSDCSRGLKRPAPASRLSQITIMGLEPRVQLDVAGRSENFLVDTGSTYSVLTRAFSSQNCAIFSPTGKTITENSPEHFVAGTDKYFPTSF